MRLAQYTFNDELHAGISHEGYYSFADLLGSGAPDTVLDFIRAYEDKALPDFKAIIAEKRPKSAPPEKVRLHSPICPFRNVICLGTNYADHAKETAASGIVKSGASVIPAKPVFFSKNANPAAGEGGVVSLRSHFTQKVDYEVELAVIIGKTVSRIAPEEAEETIFGYTVLNDITARDIQMEYGQWYFGKSLDGFCSIGPDIVTRDELPLPIKLDVSCRVNGETRQSSNTANLIFDIPQIISTLSQGMTLFAGDVIATGTPGGIGHAMQPPRYLKKGDKVECEIERVGVLTNFFE